MAGRAVREVVVFRNMGLDSNENPLAQGVVIPGIYKCYLFQLVQGSN